MIEVIFLDEHGDPQGEIEIDESLNPESLVLFNSGVITFQGVAYYATDGKQLNKFIFSAKIPEPRVLV